MPRGELTTCIFDYRYENRRRPMCTWRTAGTFSFHCAMAAAFDILKLLLYSAPAATSELSADDFASFAGAATSLCGSVAEPKASESATRASLVTADATRVSKHSQRVCNRSFPFALFFFFASHWCIFLDFCRCCLDCFRFFHSYLFFGHC